jgi:hypothetical protein
LVWMTLVNWCALFVEISATGRSLVQRSSTKCEVFKYDR